MAAVIGAHWSVISQLSEPAYRCVHAQRGVRLFGAMHQRHFLLLLLLLLQGLHCVTDWRRCRRLSCAVVRRNRSRRRLRHEEDGHRRSPRYVLTNLNVIYVVRFLFSCLFFYHQRLSLLLIFPLAYCNLTNFAPDAMIRVYFTRTVFDVYSYHVSYQYMWVGQNPTCES